MKTKLDPVIAGKVEGHKRIIRAVKPHKELGEVLKELQTKGIVVTKRQLQKARKAAKQAAVIIGAGLNPTTVKIKHATAADRLHAAIVDEHGESAAKVYAKHIPESDKTLDSLPLASLHVASLNSKLTSQRSRSLANYNRVFNPRRFGIGNSSAS